MATYFTSDTHFSQERTFKYSMRSMYFDSVEHADEEMIKRWNAVVGPEDVVYHLGDFGNKEIAKRLNGKIYLLFGNYERNEEHIGEFPKEEQDKFELIFKGATLSTVVDGQRLVMVHEPSHLLRSEETVAEGYFGLFGHIHEKQKVKRHALNVGVDVHNFTPVSIDTIKFYRSAIEGLYDRECFDNFEIGGDNE